MHFCPLLGSARGCVWRHLDFYDFPLARRCLAPRGCPTYDANRRTRKPLAASGHKELPMHVGTKDFRQRRGYLLTDDAPAVRWEVKKKNSNGRHIFDGFAGDDVEVAKHDVRGNNCARVSTNSPPKQGEKKNRCRVKDPHPHACARNPKGTVRGSPNFSSYPPLNPPSTPPSAILHIFMVTS